MSLGFEQAGFDVVAAVELDPIHASIHHFNFPHCRTIAESVSEICAADIFSRIPPRQRSIDVVMGGAPCQGFSLIGKRMIDDPRNKLVKDFVRLVAELDAKYFVFENVKGLTVGKHKQFLNDLVCQFQECGYEVLLPYEVLNAKDFGVPQNRERLFLLGGKRGLAMPEYPEARFGEQADLFDSCSVRQRITCQQALEDIPNIEEYEDLLTSDEVRVGGWIAESDYAKDMHCVSESAWHCGYERIFDPEVLTSSLRTLHTESSRERFRQANEGSIEPVSRFFKLPKDGQSNTLRAGTDSARGAFTSPRPIHYKYDRCISVREMARLHGFPDWFRFHVTKWHGARQIGNSVPPPLARAVANQIVVALGVDAIRPASPVQLGDSTLLKYDMTNAAGYWGIKVPIEQRVRTGIVKEKSRSYCHP